MATNIVWFNEDSSNDSNFSWFNQMLTADFTIQIIMATNIVW